MPVVAPSSCAPPNVFNLRFRGRMLGDGPGSGGLDCEDEGIMMRGAEETISYGARKQPVEREMLASERLMFVGRAHSRCEGAFDEDMSRRDKNEMIRVSLN